MTDGTTRSVSPRLVAGAVVVLAAAALSASFWADGDRGLGLPAALPPLACPSDSGAVPYPGDPDVLVPAAPDSALLCFYPEGARLEKDARLARADAERLAVLLNDPRPVVTGTWSCPEPPANTSANWSSTSPGPSTHRPTTQATKI